MNPILNLIHGNQNGSNPMLSSNPNESRMSVSGILGMFNTFRNAKDPNDAMNAMINQNPQVQSIVNMINNQYGGDGKAAFYAKAKEMGIDPESILGLMK